MSGKGQSGVSHLPVPISSVSASNYPLLCSSCLYGIRWLWLSAISSEQSRADAVPWTNNINQLCRSTISPLRSVAMVRKKVKLKNYPCPLLFYSQIFCICICLKPYLIYGYERDKLYGLLYYLFSGRYVNMQIFVRNCLA